MRFLSLRIAIIASVLAAPLCLAQTPAAPAAAPATAAAPAANGDIKLPDLPSGMCPVDPTQDADRGVIPDLHLATQGKYKLLAVYGECQNLRELRSGTSRVISLNYYGDVIAQDSTETLNRAATIQTAASVIALTGAYQPEAPKPKGSELVGLGVRRASYQAILKQTSDYLIVGTEQRHLVGAKQLSFAAVTLITVVNGKIVTVNLYAPANEDRNYGALSAVAESYGMQLLALNP